MIAIIAGDKVALSTEGLDQHLEESISVIDPDLSFEYVHDAHRGFAEDAARDFNQAQVGRIEDELRQGRQILEAKERLTRKKEFSLWKQALNATAAEIRKRVKLVQFFGDFPIEKIIAIARCVNIYGLCVPKFTALIEKLKELPVLASDIIRQLVKEARPPRAPKQQQESSVEWQRNDEGGGRHLSINLHNDELGVEIKTSAKEQQITEQEAIAQAFRKSKLVDRAVRDKNEAIAQVRDKQIEMQRDLIKKDERINDLSQQLVQRNGRIEDLENLLASVSSVALPYMEMTETSVASIATWKDVAQLVDGDRSTFLDTMKTWSVERKEALPKLLAEYVEVNYPECLDEFGWIPDKLLCAALQRISFAVQKVVGPNNLVDEPELKTFYHCKFVSLRDFGTRQERWLFQTKDGKHLPIFGREEFSVERF